MAGDRPPCVVVTDGEGPGLRLAARLRQAGAEVRLFPVVTSAPAPDRAALEAALTRLDRFAWIAFTSARAVEAVGGHPALARVDWSAPARPRIAAVGPMTEAAIRARGLGVDLCPEVAGARALAEAMIAEASGGLSGRTVLWPRSDLARPEFSDILTAAGAVVVAPVAYCTRPARPDGADQLAEDVRAGRIAAVVFLSPSAAANFAELMPGGSAGLLCGATIVASVGPATSGALAALGAPADVEAGGRTAGDLAAALLSYLGLSGPPEP